MMGCPVCKSDNIFRLRTYKGRNAVFTGMDLDQCNSCKMVFANPMPTEEQLDSYNSNYFGNAHKGKAGNLIEVAFFEGIAQLRYQYVQDYIIDKGKDIKRVFEVGPGPGYFAKHWLEKNPTAQYFAIESDTSCHKSLKDAGVILVDGFADSQIKSADLVVISHVLEHVTNPLAFLEAATRQLKPGGILFIEVPCQDWKHKPQDEPHLLFFDKKPMLKLLSLLEFEQINVSYHGQQIAVLEKAMKSSELSMRIRNKLISMGVHFFFGRQRKGMEGVEGSLERAVVAPYMAHVESETPAWWLRAITVKSSNAHE